MSPAERRRRKYTRRSDRALAVAVLLGVALSFVALGRYLDDRSASRHDDVEREQVAQVMRSRLGCQRSLLDRADGIQRDRDIADFALSAAVKNRAVGGKPETIAAARYEGIASRAAKRQRFARGRMLGADPAPARVRAASRAACARAYPLPRG